MTTNPYLSHTSKLPPEDARKAEALMRPAKDTFERLLGILASFPDDKICKLADLTYKIVGAKVVPTVVATDPEVVRMLMRFSGVNFALLGDASVDPVVSNPVLFVRLDLFELAKVKPDMQLGAIVTAGSHAIDAWRGHFGPMKKEELAKVVETADKRGRIHEAQLLLKLRELEPSFEPNRWQRQILKEWPLGWASKGAGELWYEPGEWVD